MSNTKRSSKKEVKNWSDHTRFKSVLARNEYVDLCLTDLKKTASTHRSMGSLQCCPLEDGTFQPELPINFCTHRGLKAKCVGCFVIFPMIDMKEISFSHCPNACSFICTPCNSVWQEELTS